MAKRLIARLFTIGIMMCVTVGSSFLLSEHYACLMSQDMNNSKMFFFKSANYTRSQLVSQSREIGWVLIMASLVMTFLIALLQLMFNKPTHMEKALKTYISLQRKESRTLLEEALSRLSTRIVEGKLDSATKNLRAHGEYDNEGIKNVLALFKHEKKKILTSKQNFRPPNMSFREKMHFFSMSFDDNMDQS
ncbi:hypothetical protein MXB_38 [Myxobolus squamalis]|nr:hypothetical protein MXB_38 [Myxobolus squamalis]